MFRNYFALQLNQDMNIAIPEINNIISNNSDLTKWCRLVTISYDNNGTPWGVFETAHS